MISTVPGDPIQGGLAYDLDNRTNPLILFSDRSSKPFPPYLGFADQIVSFNSAIQDQVSAIASKVRMQTTLLT